MIILGYHRISTDRPDPFGLCVSLDNFRDQLSSLLAIGPLVSIDEMLERRLCGVNEPCFSLSFDDGYVDFLDHALPLANEVSAPLAVFIPTGYPDSGREFYWEELARIILTDEPRPHHLELSLPEGSFSQEVADAAGHGQAISDWRWGPAAPHPRTSLYKELYARLRLLPHTQRQCVLDDLFDWAGLDSAPRKNTRPMTWNEIIALPGKNVTVGGHTRYHPQLSLLDPEKQREEILGGKQELENILGVPVHYLAYPHGTPTDVNETTLLTTRQAGYEAAFSVEARTLSPQDDPFLLPRLCVGDVSGPTLVETINPLLGGSHA